MCDYENLRNLKDYFYATFHVQLKLNWLDEALRYIFDFSDIREENELIAQVFYQWTNTDIEATTEPSPELLDNFRRNGRINHRCALQVDSLLDVGSSLWSQYKSLTNPADDNSSFSADFADEYENYQYKNPKQVMRLVLTDGINEFNGVEQRHVDGLSLFTCPGCKILLKGEVRIFNGFMMLNSDNCQVFNGAVPKLVSKRPLEQIAKILGKTIPDQPKLGLPIQATSSDKPKPSLPIQATIPNHHKPNITTQTAFSNQHRLSMPNQMTSSNQNRSSLPTQTTISNQNRASLPIQTTSSNHSMSNTSLHQMSNQSGPIPFAFTREELRRFSDDELNELLESASTTITHIISIKKERELERSKQALSDSRKRKFSIDYNA